MKKKYEKLVFFRTFMLKLQVIYFSDRLYFRIGSKAYFSELSNLTLYIFQYAGFPDIRFL